MRGNAKKRTIAVFSIILVLQMRNILVLRSFSIHYVTHRYCFFEKESFFIINSFLNGGYNIGGAICA